MIREYQENSHEWNLMVPLKFNNYDGILLYDKKNGYAELRKIESDASLSLVKSFTGFRKTWKSIHQIFRDDKNIILLFYDKVNGEGEFYKISPDGNLSLQQTCYNWRKTWDIITIITFDFSSLTLFYDKNSGEGELYKTDSRNYFYYVKTIKGWFRNWTKIVSYSVSDYNVVIFYTAENGNAESYKITSSGNLSNLFEYKNWLPGWNEIIPLSTKMEQFLLFYNRNKKTQELYQIYKDGNLSAPKNYSQRKFASNNCVVIPNNDVVNLIILDNNHGLTVFKDTFASKINGFIGRNFILDGSNIIRFHQQINKCDPSIEIFLVTMKVLNNRKANVFSFFDENTFYQSSNSDKLFFKKIFDKKIAYSIPSGMQADEFILEHADNCDGYIVSNDRFRDRADLYKWVVDSNGRKSNRLIGGKVINNTLLIPKLKIKVSINVNINKLISELVQNQYYL